MSTFAVTLLCIQFCVVQTVFGQIGWCGDASIMSPFDYAPGIWASTYGETYGAYGFPGAFVPGAYDGFPGPWAGALSTGPAGSYGGAGVGEVAVSGELPAGGATAVAGQVPILGAVEFAGPVRAAGTITISGTCACGCGGSFIY